MLTIYIIDTSYFTSYNILTLYIYIIDVNDMPMTRLILLVIYKYIK